jgi:hypothetical protein
MFICSQTPWTLRSLRKEVFEMPYNERLLSVSGKEQRMYEHIKEGELKQGRPVKRAKAIAAGDS